MLGHFQQPVKPCSVTPHFRTLATCAALALLPASGIQARQPSPPFDAWSQCEADELAGEIVPIDPSAPPPDESPTQAEASRVESSPTQSLLEGDVRLERGGQRLRAERVTLERPGNVARVDSPLRYGDSRQSVRGKRAEVDLNAKTGWFKDVDYYLNQAGGCSDNARKSKKFIVYMNGQVTKVKGSGKKQIEPGCEIIVPSKAKKKGNIANILGYATSFSSLGMMIASIANLIKK